jgi:hypothetical protein
MKEEIKKDRLREREKKRKRDRQTESEPERVRDSKIYKSQVTIKSPSVTMNSPKCTLLKIVILIVLLLGLGGSQTRGTSCAIIFEMFRNRIFGEVKWKKCHQM